MLFFSFFFENYSRFELKFVLNERGSKGEFGWARPVRLEVPLECSTGLTLSGGRICCGFQIGMLFTIIRVTELSP